MTRVAVVGAGGVGTHAARHLLATDSIDEVVLHDADSDRAGAVAAELGGAATSVDGPVEALFDRSLAAVAVAAADATPIVAAALERRVASAASADDPEVIRGLLELEPAARAAGVVVIAGAGLAPGLSEVLADFAAERNDTVEEVHVSRYGVSGPACAQQRRRNAWGAASELDDGAWVERRAGTGRRLVAFPPPVGPHDCRRAVSAVPRLVERTVPGVGRVSFRDAARRLDRVTGAVPPPAGGRKTGSLGGLHVEVRARRGARSEVLVYGTVDLMAPMTGAILATATLAAAGLAGDPTEPGVRGLGEVGGASVLSELGHRGVRTARFGG